VAGEVAPHLVPDAASVLGPVVRGAADLVVAAPFGSRPGWDGRLLRRLTGVELTDPARDLRAMRAEVSAVVRAEQSRHPEVELVVAALARGHHVAERALADELAGPEGSGARARAVLRAWRRHRRSPAARRGAPLASRRDGGPARV
jgi:hypothetical protein